jgi:hypothetical protein
VRTFIRSSAGSDFTRAVQGGGGDQHRRRDQVGEFKTGRAVEQMAERTDRQEGGEAFIVQEGLIHRPGRRQQGRRAAGPEAEHADAPGVRLGPAGEEPAGAEQVRQGLMDSGRPPPRRSLIEFQGDDAGLVERAGIATFPMAGPTGAVQDDNRRVRAGALGAAQPRGDDQRRRMQRRKGDIVKAGHQAS